MDNQQAVVDQIVQNLAFDIEAVPKNKSNQATCISQSTPLNVKIKVRKKDEIQKQHDVLWIADDTSKSVQKVRLVNTNSDRTIMTFDVSMEAEFGKKPRKQHKKFFEMLRPGICLEAVDDDKSPYMPSSSYSANIPEPTKATKSDGTFKQTFTLSKNMYQDYSVSTQQGGSKWLFGKCKPGGCLDPPFSEDKYSYKPSTRSGPEQEAEEELLDEENVRSDVNSNKKPIILHVEETQSNGRHSSIFDSGLFKKKRKSSDKSSHTKFPDRTDSIVDIYHGESSTNSASTRSNSIITYPPKTKSAPRMSDDKSVRSRDPSEDKPRKSFNDHSEPCFIPPKGVNRIKEQDILDPSDHTKHESSDLTELRQPSVNESFKMPVPLPIPTPDPIPIMSNTRKPEDIDPNYDILATQVTELPKQESQEQELPEKMNLRGAATPQLLCKKSATEGIDDKLVESSKIESFSSNVGQPSAPNKFGDKNMNESKLQPFEEIDRENNMDETGLPKKNEKIESLGMPKPLTIPIPVPFNLSDPVAAAVYSETKNENLKTSDMNLAQLKQSFETPIIKDKHFEDSKDMQKNIDPENRSIENESTLNATSKSQYSDIGAKEIPKDYLRTRSFSSDQESETENQENDTVTKLPAETKEKWDSKVQEITKSNDKPPKKNDIKDVDTAATKGEPKKDKRKDSQRISQSKLSILQKSISLLSGSNSTDKHPDKVGDNGSDLGSLLSGSKSSTASAKDKRDTKGGDSPNKHSDTVGDKSTDLGSLLSGSKTSTKSAKDKRDTKRGDSPDKHSDKVGDKGTDLGSLLSGSKTSTASARDTKRGDSSDKHSDKVGDKGTDFGSLLSGSKTSTASVKSKTDTKRGDSPDKHSDKVGDKGTDLISLLSRSKTSTKSAKDKRDTKRGDIPDKHSDKVGDKGTDLGSLLSGSKTSTASARDTKRGDSSDKHSDKVGDKGTDLGSLLIGSKTSTASAISKKDTKRGDSPDKHSDKVGAKSTDLGSLLSGSKTSTASAKDKRDTKRSYSPNKHSDKVEDKGTDLGSLLSGSKTSTASAKDKRDTKRSDSPDKHLDKVGAKGTDLGSLLSGSKTLTASAKDNRDKKRSLSPDKYVDNVGGKDTVLVSLLSGSKTSTASARDTKRGDSPDKHSDKVEDKSTDLGSLLSGSKTSTASAKDKTDTKRSDSPDKHLDTVGCKGTDLGSLLSGSKTLTASAKDNRDKKRSLSPDKYVDNVGGKDTVLVSLLSGSKTSTASARDTKRGDSPDKHSDKVEDKSTDLGSLLSGSKTSTASAKDKTDTKRSDSPDKHLDTVGCKGTDLGSLFSGSKTSTASAKDDRDKKRSLSPDKYLDNVGDRDTDLGIPQDEKQTSLPSGPKHEIDSGDGKITEPLSDKEHVVEITEPNNDSNIDSYSKGQARFPNEDNVNLTAAPVIIDNTEPSPKSGKLKKIDSETKILGEPMNIDREYDPSGIPFTTKIASRFRESDEDDETHSTVSRGLVGTQSVIYDADELIPTTSAQKHTERVPSSDERLDSRLSSIQSTSTLKSAMRKDLISVDFGFHSYLNDKNERILRTFDVANSPTRLSNDSVTVLKTQMKISSNEIRIPVDSEHDMFIQIKKSNANQRVSISESGFVHDIDNSRVKKQKSPVLSSDAELRKSEATVEEKKVSTLESDATEDHFTNYYEQELVPLQLIIKNLRNEIDVLAAQQVVFKDKLFCSNNALFAQNKSKLPRLVHSNKKCYGCLRK